MANITKRDIEEMFSDKLRRDLQDETKFGKNAISEIADALYNSPSARRNLQNMMEHNLQSGKSNKGVIRSHKAADGANAGFENDGQAVVKIGTGMTGRGNGYVAGSAKAAAVLTSQE